MTGSFDPDSYEVDFGDQDLTGAEQERLVSGRAETAERDAEAALRPKGLADFIGQPQVREQLSLVLDAAKARQKAPDHVLLSGPPGLGKTTLAMIIAHEMNSSLRVTSGPAVQHAGDLAAILSSLEEGEVLFIDEIHRMARAMRWISSMKRTSPSSREDRMAARSPACWTAGPDVTRRLEFISWAMIIASVVLPSPGGPESSTWSGAFCLAFAASRTRESCSRTCGWPMKSARPFGRSAASASRSAVSARPETSLSCSAPVRS